MTGDRTNNDDASHTRRQFLHTSLSSLRVRNRNAYIFARIAKRISFPIVGEEYLSVSCLAVQGVELLDYLLQEAHTPLGNQELQEASGGGVELALLGHLGKDLLLAGVDHRGVVQELHQVVVHHTFKGVHVRVNCL